MIGSALIADPSRYNTQYSAFSASIADRKMVPVTMEILCDVFQKHSLINRFLHNVMCKQITLADVRIKPFLLRFPVIRVKFATLKIKAHIMASDTD